MNKMISYLFAYKGRFAILVLFVLVSLSIFSGLPELTGDLAGFKLNNNWHFDQYNKADSIFKRQKKIILHVTPLNNNRNIVFQSVKQLSINLKKSHSNLSIVSPLTFYQEMDKHKIEDDTSLLTFFNYAEDIPILNQLIAKDKKSFLVMVSYDKNEQIVVSEFDKVVRNSLGGVLIINAMSDLHIEENITNLIRSDIAKIVCVIVLFFFLYILLVFRSLKAILFTCVLVISTVFLALFLFSIFDFQLNMISVLALPIVLILALSDALHLMSSYVKYLGVKAKDERVKTVLSHLIIPSVFSSVTTSAAFFSFYLFNESPFIKEFGLVTSIALILEVVVIFFIAPYLLFVLNLTKVYDKSLMGLSLFFVKIKKPVTILLILIIVIGAFLLNKLQFKSSNEMFFPTGSEIQKTHFELNKNYASNLVLDVLISLNELDSINNKQSEFDDAYLYDYTKMLANEFRKNELVVNVNSATDKYLFKTKYGLSLDLYKLLGNKNPYYDKASGTYRIEIKMTSGDDIVIFKNEVLESLLLDKPDRVSISYSSLAILTDELNKSVSSSLIQSLSSSGLVIFFMIFLLTRSVKTSLFSLVPNIVPLAFAVIVFYVFDINLNIITAITGVICLGLLDDDTVHILYRRLWLKEPMEELSFSILSSAILLISGFSFFLLSGFEPIRVFGWVSALLFFVGVLSEMTLMQWILEDRKKLK